MSSFWNTHHALLPSPQWPERTRKSCAGTSRIPTQLDTAPAQTNSRGQPQQCRQQCKWDIPVQPDRPRCSIATATTLVAAGAHVAARSACSTAASADIPLVAAKIDTAPSCRAPQGWPASSHQPLTLTFPKIWACTPCHCDSDRRALPVWWSRPGQCPQRPVPVFHP